MLLARCVGHRQALALLTRAAARGALPPSLLFAGRPGVGKFTVAAALAQALNCESPVAGESPVHVDACGECRSCRRFTRAVGLLQEGKDIALDCFVRVAPDNKGTIKVDVVRALLAQAGFRPFDGRRRVAVIDGADALGVAAQNALLKVLEEPPAATHFVLVTSRPDSLLATVRSRCPRIRFGPLVASEVADVLVRDHGIDRPRALSLAAMSDGSVGAALARASGALPAERDAALDVLDAIVQSRDPADRLKVVSPLLRRPAVKSKKGDAAVTRQGLLRRLDALKVVVRDACAMASEADRRAIANADVVERLARVGAVCDRRRLVRAFGAVGQAQAALERNVQPKVVADWLAMQL